MAGLVIVLIAAAPFAFWFFRRRTKRRGDEKGPEYHPEYRPTISSHIADEITTAATRFERSPDRLPSKQDVVGSSPTGRATSFRLNDLSAKAFSPDHLLFRQMVEDAGLWRFSSFFHRSSCLREPHSILYPLRITPCHKNVVHAKHVIRTLGKSNRY